MLTKQVAGRTYNYSYVLGRNAQMGNGFSLPMDFALGSDESLYVSSRAHEFYPAQGITKCTMNHELIWDARGLGYADGGSLWPSSVDIDSSENVYISDDYAGQVIIYDKDGNYQGKWGAKGSGDGEFSGPSGIAFDKKDNLYVVDCYNSRIQKLTREGTFLAKWGSFGSGDGEFNMPWGLAIDEAGDVYVADWKNDRVQKFSAEGEYLATFGSSGTGDGELRCPSSVAIDDAGDVYVTDWGNNRLNIYTANGTFLAALIGDAHRLSPWGQDVVDANPDYVKARQRVDLTPEFRFERPVAVNVDDQGRIMVLDQQRSRIQIYTKEKNFVEPQFNL